MNVYPDYEKINVSENAYATKGINIEIIQILLERIIFIIYVSHYEIYIGTIFRLTQQES